MTDGRGLKLIGFLRNLVRFLDTGGPFFRVEIEETLRGLQENLVNVRAQYEAEGPEGTEAIRVCMLETLDLFYAAVDDVFAYLEDGARPHLTDLLEKAQEADDILGYIEYQIDQNKLWMSEYSAG